MGTSQAQKAESRERILSAAAEQIRKGGFESISIGELMKTAGLTHGAFYAHFPSRGALLAAALERALSDGQRRAHKAASKAGQPTLASSASIAKTHLSAAHRDAPHRGCAVPALAAEAARGNPDMQDIMHNGLEGFIDRLAETIGDGPEAREQAIAAWCSMVGGLMLSRASGNNPLADEILAAARRSIAPDSH